MTNIEKQFFKTFGIEPKMLCECSFKNLYDYRIDYGSDVCIRMDDDIKNPCDSCELAKQIHPLYPKITDRILLELVCILNKHYCENYQCATMLIGLTLNEVKRCILVECLENEKHIRQQVRALFREEK